MMLFWLFRNKYVLFLWASLAGIFFALVWRQYEEVIHRTLIPYRSLPNFDFQDAYQRWLSSLGLRSLSSPRRNSTVKNPNITGPTEAQWLSEQVPVLCVVLTKKLKNSLAVKNTWGKRCNKLLFYGPYNDDKVPVNKIDTKDKWELLCHAMLNAWKGYGEFNWTIFVDDLTYVVVENLRYMLGGLNPNQSLYLGHAFLDFFGQYNTEEAGITLSRRALVSFGQQVSDSSMCQRVLQWKTAGQTFGSLMHNAGIVPLDTRDMKGRGRFLALRFDKLLNPGSLSIFSRYWSNSVYPSPEGSGCCSDFAVTFHDISADKMLTLEYFIYHLKPITNMRERSINEPDSRPPGSDNPVKVEKKSDGKKSDGKKSVVGKAFVSEIKLKKNKNENQGVTSNPTQNRDKVTINEVPQKVELTLANKNSIKSKDENVENAIDNDVEHDYDVVPSKSWWSSDEKLNMKPFGMTTTSSIEKAIVRDSSSQKDAFNSNIKDLNSKNANGGGFGIYIEGSPLVEKIMGGEGVGDDIEGIY